MESNLYAISNIKTTGSELIKRKGEILQELNDLDFDYTLFPKAHHSDYFNSDMPRQSWEIEHVGSEEEDRLHSGASSLITFAGPTVYRLRLYEYALEIQMLYQYSFLYHTLSNPYLEDFRKNLRYLTGIFGGDEIIFLADSGCDKLSEVLELDVWKGMSFEKVKEKIISMYPSLIRHYPMLDLGEPDYSDIREIIFEDFRGTNL